MFVLSRYDYEECDGEKAKAMMDDLERKISSQELIGKSFDGARKTYKVKLNDNFSYTDPIDNSKASKQVKTSLMMLLFWNDHLLEI